jgi:predicted hotdog family 3-hydroxylacyl-ACP dehydratase
LTALPVPHQPPMLLIEALRSVDGEACVALARVDAAAWYADADGAMPAWFGVELMAQAAAAFNGHAAQKEGLPPAIGYLVGTKEYRSTVPRFPAGAELEVEARLLYPATFGQSAMTCEIRHRDVAVASATLKFFVPK